MLTDKQKLFVDEYLIDLNATQAAIRAGYNPKTAGQTGSENLKKPYIRRLIDKRLSEKRKGLIMSQDEILATLTEIARGNEESAALRGTGGGAQKVIFMQPTTSERIKALETLGRYHTMFTDRQEVMDVTPEFYDNVPLEDDEV